MLALPPKAARPTNHDVLEHVWSFWPWYYRPLLFRDLFGTWHAPTTKVPCARTAVSHSGPANLASTSIPNPPKSGTVKYRPVRNSRRRNPISDRSRNGGLAKCVLEAWVPMPQKNHWAKNHVGITFKPVRSRPTEGRGGTASTKVPCARIANQRDPEVVCWPSGFV